VRIGTGGKKTLSREMTGGGVDVRAMQAALRKLLAQDLNAGITAELLSPIVVQRPASSVAPLPPAGRASDPSPLTGESGEAEVRRLELSVDSLSEVNDRVMAQNIALLHDLEAAQRAVRDLRAEKDALAVQLRRALEREEAGGRAR